MDYLNTTISAPYFVLNLLLQSFPQKANTWTIKIVFTFFLYFGAKMKFFDDSTVKTENISPRFLSIF